MALACDPRRHRRRYLYTLRYISILRVLIGLTAAFDYDYNALDAGGRSNLSKAYDNLL